MYILFRGTWAQRARIASGLILFVFALTHFTNHALGLVSVQAMEQGQTLRWAVTRSVPGAAILGAALLVHMTFGLARLARRSTLRMPAWEWLQVALGLAIPLLLLPHIVNTRIAYTFFNVNDFYVYELARLWPASAVSQSLLLLIVWIHGSIGIHFWLRLAPWYRVLAPVLLAFAVAIPLLALAGFSVAGREIAAAMQDPEAAARIMRQTRWPDTAAEAGIAAIRDWARWGYAAVLVIIGLVLVSRKALLRFVSGIMVRYVPGGPAIRAPVGPTLLEISRMHGIPHLSVCGGRARCSTCRVEVLEGLGELPPPAHAERETLASIAAGEHVRLACQLRPRTPLAILRLLRPETSATERRRVSEEAHGVERAVALMFLDIRGFTAMSAKRLPYDVVFILNHFFDEAHHAIIASGGTIDKYLGDGLMAVFGTREGPHAGAREALEAAWRIDQALGRVNAGLESEIDAPLAIGMGIHAGPVVMGRIGAGPSAQITVIGRTVNTAARLEAMTKDLGCQLVVSSAAARAAGLAGDLFESRSVAVRGLDQPVEILVIARARDLPHEILAQV